MIEILRRKLHLNDQAIKLIRGEREEIRHLLALVKLRDHLTRQIGPEGDLELSQQIDCCQYLIDTLGARPSDPCGSALATSGAPSLSGRENQSGHFQR
jgi:hypothetical protein